MDLAASYFIETIQIDSSYSNAYYSLGLINETQGNLEVAKAIFERVLELNPGHEEVIQKIEDLKTQISE